MKSQATDGTLHDMLQELGLKVILVPQSGKLTSGKLTSLFDDVNELLFQLTHAVKEFKVL